MTYDKDKGILYGVADQQLSLEELGQAMQDILHSTEYPPNTPALWDLRKLDFKNIDKTYIQNLMALRKDNPQRGQAKIAIIADQDLGFGLSRMYEMLSDDLPQRIMVFRNMSDGEAWLLEDSSS